MDCRAFYKWLEERDLYDVSEADQALRHAEKCPECRELYCKDETLDSKLCQEFSRIPLPVKLKNRIDLDLDRQSIRKTKSSWWYKAVPLAMAAMLALFYIMPLSSNFESMEIMGGFILADHLKHDDSVMLVHQLDELPEWCVGKVEFEVTEPDMPPHYTFIGARLCNLGAHQSVHLSYMVDGKRVSLFIFDSDEIRLALNTRDEYDISLGGHTIRFWSDKSRVFALIS